MYACYCTLAGLWYTSRQPTSKPAYSISRKMHDSRTTVQEDGRLDWVGALMIVITAF